MKAVECRRSRCRISCPPGERVAIPFEGRTLAGILRKPHGRRDAPAGAGDGVRARFLQGGDRRLRAPFLDARHRHAGVRRPRPGRGRVRLSDPRQLRDRGRRRCSISSMTRAPISIRARIGLWGVSLGGYYAPRAAAFEKRLKAVHRAVRPVRLSRAAGTGSPGSPARRSASAATAPTRPRRNAIAATLSLKGVAKSITCPLCIVAGKQDRLVPWQDAERLAREASGAGRADADRRRQSRRQQPRLSLAPADRGLDGRSPRRVTLPRELCA